MASDAPVKNLLEEGRTAQGWSNSINGANDGAGAPLLDLLIVVLKRKRIVFWCTIASAVSSILISFVLPKTYTASVTLLPPQQTSSLSAALTSQLGGMGGVAALAGGGLGIKNPNDMYVAMLKSRTVEDAMVRRFGLAAEYHQRYTSWARKALENHTKIDGNGKDGLIHLDVEDRDPQRAADLANGFVDEFRRLSEHLAISEAAQRRLFFEQQLKQAKNQLADAEEALKRTQQQTGLIQLDSQAQALIQASASIRAQIVAKEVEIKSLQTFATDQNDELVKAEHELEGLRSQLARLGGSESESEVGLIVPRGKVPEAGLEYIRKYREVKYYETIFGILARQFEVAKLDEAKQGATIQVVDAAIPPDRRSSPKRSLIVLGGTLAGFLIGVTVTLLRATFVRFKTDPRTIGKYNALRRAASLRS